MSVIIGNNYIIEEWKRLGILNYDIKYNTSLLHYNPTCIKLKKIECILSCSTTRVKSGII